MAFTFPTDTNNKAGAVKSTATGTDFFVPSREQGSESISHGWQAITTSGTPVQMPNVPCREVTIIAKRINTGYIYVGGSTINSTNYGAELAGKDSITLKVSNLNLIYLDASVSGEGVSYIVI